MTQDARLAELQQQLFKEIKAAADGLEKPLGPDAVAKIVTYILDALKEEVSQADLHFYNELADLAHYINQAKHDIAAIQPKQISTEYIPSATDELDAVVGATEEATNKIMDVCDEITALAGHCPPEVNEKLIGCTTKIFEACNFQDITGQRITTVVEALKHIDAKIAVIVKAMGDEIEHVGGTQLKHVHAPDPEKGLLNGPQLAKNAINQDEIDRLLSGN